MEKEASFSKKLLIPIGIAFILLILILAGSAKMWVVRKSIDMYSGRITELKETGFTITDPRGKVTEIVVTEETRIEKGRKEIDSLHEGEQVLVSGIRQGDLIEAKTIRIFEKREPQF